MLDGPSARVLVSLEVAEQAGLSLASLTEGWLDGGALQARVPFALGNRDIADRLGCTVGTVEQHVSAVLVRSRLSSRTDVLRACHDAQSDTDLPGP